MHLRRCATSQIVAVAVIAISTYGAEVSPSSYFIIIRMVMMKTTNAIIRLLQNVQFLFPVSQQINKSGLMLSPQCHCQSLKMTLIYVLNLVKIEESHTL